MAETTTYGYRITSKRGDIIAERTDLERMDLLFALQEFQVKAYKLYVNEGVTSHTNRQGITFELL